MKPYYTGNGVTIYHGDCLEILPTLGVNHADILVTDPPYGVAWEGRGKKTSFGPIRGDHSQELGLLAVGEALKVVRRDRHAYIFGRWDFPNSGIRHENLAELVWDKCIMGLGDLGSPWGPQHEYIQFLSASKDNKNRGECLAARIRKGTVLRFQRPHSAGVRHPTEKPVGLLRELIESSSRITETVLDPFLGSGSTAVASILEGRKCTGIEVEEKWCEMAAGRIESGTLPLFS